MSTLRRSLIILAPLLLGGCLPQCGSRGVKLGRADASAVVLVERPDASPTDTGPSIPTVAEREPNDTPPQAQPLEPGRPAR